MSELWIAFSMGLLGKTGAGPVRGRSTDHPIIFVPVGVVACELLSVVASENLQALASGGEVEIEVVVIAGTESHFAHLQEPTSEGDACRKPFTAVEVVPIAATIPGVHRHVVASPSLGASPAAVRHAAVIIIIGTNAEFADLDELEAEP